jgi:predicted metal-dependent peptidase
MATASCPLEFKLAKAKTKLIFDQPFFATLSMNLPWVRNDTLDPPTMATDGETIYWHGDFVQKSSHEELVFVVCHEIYHCVFQHIPRLGTRDPLKWNIATDVVINDLLKTDNIGTMPAGAIDMSQLAQAGKHLAEEVYNLLPDNPSGKGRNGTNGKPLDQMMPASGSQADQTAKANAMKVKVAQAAQAAKMCGKLSAGLERIVGEVLQPKVDWRDVLRRFVAVRAKTETSFCRPKRRFAAEDIYLPSKSGETLGQLLIAVDCSGSIGQRELDEFAAEIRAIHEDLRPERIHVVYFDASISYYESYEPENVLNIRPHGGGGTDFAPIFKYADDYALEVCACVVLTDLYCSSFGSPPNYPVLWCSNGDDKAPFGEVVRMRST